MSYAEDMGHDMPDYFDYENFDLFSHHDKRKKIKIEISGIRKETDKAILIDYKNRIYWVPKSQIKQEKDVIELPKWLFDKMMSI